MDLKELDKQIIKILSTQYNSTYIINKPIQRNEIEKAIRAFEK